MKNQSYLLEPGISLLMGRFRMLFRVREKDKNATFGSTASNIAALLTEMHLKYLYPESTLLMTYFQETITQPLPPDCCFMPKQLPPLEQVLCPAFTSPCAKDKSMCQGHIQVISIIYGTGAAISCK